MTQVEEDPELPEHWRTEGLHWHCHAREHPFDPNHKYPAPDGETPTTVSRDPYEVADWLTGAAREAHERAAATWQANHGSRFDDDGAGRDFHARTAAAGKPTSSLVRTRARQVVLLDVVPATGCH